jgi:hypothetical protein
MTLSQWIQAWLHCKFKGTVARDFLLEIVLWIFSTYMGPRFQGKGFRPLCRIREVIRISPGFPVVGYSGDCESPLKPTGAILNPRCSQQRRFSVSVVANSGNFVEL